MYEAILYRTSCSSTSSISGVSKEFDLGTYYTDTQDIRNLAYLCQNIPSGQTKRPGIPHMTRCILYYEHIDRAKHNTDIPVTQKGKITQPFHDGMQYDSSACIDEHISFHNLGKGRYDSSLVNVFSCET